MGFPSEFLVLRTKVSRAVAGSLPYSGRTHYPPDRYPSGEAMTSNLTSQTGEQKSLEKFPDFPPRDDMQNSIYLDRPAHQAAREAH